MWGICFGERIFSRNVKYHKPWITVNGIPARPLARSFKTRLFAGLLKFDVLCSSHAVSPHAAECQTAERSFYCRHMDVSGASEIFHNDTHAHFMLRSVLITRNSWSTSPQHVASPVYCGPSDWLFPVCDARSRTSKFDIMETRKAVDVPAAILALHY